MKLLTISFLMLAGSLSFKKQDITGSYKHMTYNAIEYFKLNTDSTAEYMELGCRYNLEKTGKWYFNEDTLVVHYTKYAYLDTNMLEKYFVFGDTLASIHSKDHTFGYVKIVE